MYDIWVDTDLGKNITSMQRMQKRVRIHVQVYLR